MGVKRAHIDSLNLQASQGEIQMMIKKYQDSFRLHDNATKDEFRKNFNLSTNGLYKASILYATYGCSMPIKTYHRYKDREIIEFAGLRGYNCRSEALNSSLQHLWYDMQEFRVNRIDIALDFDYIPYKVLVRLEEKREKSFTFKNTTYYKTAKEKKKNNNFDIKYYDKSKKENLEKKLYRIEFAFKASYLQDKPNLSEIQELYSSLEKTLYRYTGLNVKIVDIPSLF